MAKSKYIPNSTFRFIRRKSRNTYITSLVSMSLVLFFLGIFGGIVLVGNEILAYAQESLGMQVFLYDGLEDDRLDNFRTHLEAQPYVKELSFVTKEEAGEILLKRTGADFLRLTDGVNPLLSSFEIKLHSDYIRQDSMISIRDSLKKELIVSDVEYPGEIIALVSQNVRVLTTIFVTLAVLMIGIVFYLIFGTIKLSIYAQRLSIRTMQLIGATQSFIRRPFLMNGLRQGLLAGILSCLLLIGAYFLVQSQMLEMGMEQDPITKSSLFGLLGFLLIMGISLGLVGSYLAVNHYLNKNLDQLV